MKFLNATNDKTDQIHFDNIYKTISFEYMKQNISMYQPRSVQWHDGFSFIRKGQIGSYRELFDEEDLQLYNRFISENVIKDFEQGNSSIQLLI
jgi:hypothetical protein